MHSGCMGSPHGSVPRVFDENATPRRVLDDLGITSPAPVVVIIGGARELDGATSASARAELSRAFAEGIGPALRRQHVVVLTGGTHHGVMRIAGERLREFSTLIGVAPASQTEPDGQVHLDPNHHAVWRTKGADWGSETDSLFELADGASAGLQSGVVIVANGGDVTWTEAMRFLRAGWPVMTLRGSGRTADRLADLAGDGRAQVRLGLSDPDIEVIQVTEPIELQRRIEWRVARDELLRVAYARFAGFDAGAHAAKRQSSLFAWAIGAATFTFLLAVAIVVQSRLDNGNDAVPTPLMQFFVALSTSLPAAIAAALAIRSVVGAGPRWLSLRSVAETVGREIYRYRASQISNAQRRAAGRARLIDVLTITDTEAVAQGVALAMQRPAAVGSRPPELKQVSFAPLTAREYIKLRVEGQLEYLRHQSRTYARQDLILVVTSALMAAVTTWATTTGYALWIPLLVLAGFFAAVHRAIGRRRAAVHGFSVASAVLDRARVQWLSEGVAARNTSKRLERLVSEAEDALQAEHLGWNERVMTATNQLALADAARQVSS